ncbi:hypothetical protein E4U15_004722 [Claviceps sp. LM218 group G6]|nr:hypothetical protein E4U15_004722 [Claviceps sp. LM218 group G6]
MNPDMPDEVFLAKATLPEKLQLSQYPRLTELRMATRCSHVTQADLAAFEEDIDFYDSNSNDVGYKRDCKEYETEQKAIHHMTAMITVNGSKAPSTHLLPSTSKFETGDGKSETKFRSRRVHEREKARKRNHNALKPMRNTNNWDVWLAEYDLAATDASRNGLLRQRYEVSSSGYKRLSLYDGSGEGGVLLEYKFSRDSPFQRRKDST